MSDNFVRSEERKIKTMCNHLSGLLRYADRTKAKKKTHSVDHLILMLNEVRYNDKQSVTCKHRWIGWVQSILDAVYDVTDVDREREFSRNVLQGS